MTTTQPLRAALVGCGRIGAFTRPELAKRLGPNWMPLSHADALAKCAGIDFVACCDSDADTANRAAKEYGGIPSYTDVRTMLDRERIDILSIATRTDVREAIVTDAVNANVRGIHSEKPLAFSLAQTERVINLMREAGTAFSYGALRRYMPVFTNLRASIHSGAIGELRSITARFGWGGLLWTHPHSIDLICFLSGDKPVDWAQANFKCEMDTVRDSLVIDSDPVVVSATVMFKDGVVGAIIPEAGLSIDVAGSSGGISVVGDGAWTLVHDYGLSRDCHPPDNWSFHRDESDKSGRLFAFEALRDAVLSGKPDQPAFDRVLAQHRILFAMAQSHLEEGRRVSPDDVNQHISVTGKTNGLVA